MIELSVVIATYNRAERLRACLDALGAQAFGGRGSASEFEAVVVVDGSTDATRELLAAYRAPFPLRVVWQENAGQPSALNRGVAEAKGRFCLLMDDDIVARPGFVAEHLRVQRETGGVLAAGRLSLHMPAKADWYARRFADGWASHYARLDTGETRLTAAACYGGNLSLPREAFLAVGGFAVDLARGYDVDLAHRLIAAGLAPRYLPRAEGVQDERKTWRQLLRDEEGAGSGVVALYRRDPSTLPLGGLADFHRAARTSVACRRVLLGLGFPVGALGALGPVLDRVSRGRWYRFVRPYAFWRGVRRAASREQWDGFTGAVTILLYHAVAVPGERPTQFVVAARELAWQMSWLARAGYRVLGLEEYVRARREHRLPPSRSAVITFDDGYADNGVIAAPILARHGFGGTIFLVTDRVGDANRWDAEGALASRRILSWEEIRALERAGVRFAPHGRSHRAMEGLTDDELANEIGGAWSALRQQLEHPVPVLAFPFGLHDAAARAAAQSLGLWGACTAKPGRNTLLTPVYALRRTEIGGKTGRLRFRLAVWFGDARPIRNRRRLRS
jgi:peptidoglycan/xylan/chitin deacetylase (PgdA/CDA1 family)/GT2 family glycosyltransferase